MNYSALKKCDIANGTGFRLSFWCSGCGRHCKGCFNPEAQDPNFGKPFDDKVKQKIFKELSDPHCSGLSLLGGEPLSKLSDNRKQIIQLCKECKEKFPDKDQWIWSGYLFEEIESDPEMRPILDYVDVLVDGEFRMEEKDLSCAFKGSRNQRILDIAKWRKTGKLSEVRF